MRVALLTPMKPPDSPVPSGDRTFARLIAAALELAGHTVILPTAFTTWCRTPEAFDDVARAGLGEAQTVVARLARDGPPDAVLTYHNYHKAPDLVGPQIAAAFAIPYAIVEASRAPKRAAGPWAAGFAHADAALAAADALGAVTARDLPALAEFAPETTVRLPPFVDTAPFAAPAEGGGGCHLVTAVMMRAGRKADSVRVLADAFAIVARERPEARLTIAGDGPERAALEPLFPSGTFAGRLEQPALAALFSRADVFVWPAIEEPFGFVFLEAQAAGLPVVGGASRGVVDVVRDGETGLLVTPDDPAAIAGAILTLLADSARRGAMAEAARAFAAENDLAAGARRLDALIDFAASRHSAAGKRAAAELP